jgi:hypothetical protein
MPTEARIRAARCRERAEECIRLAETAPDTAARKNYLDMAGSYLAAAEAEMTLADRLERLGTASPGAPAQSTPL